MPLFPRYATGCQNFINSLVNNRSQFFISATLFLFCMLSFFNSQITYRIFLVRLIGQNSLIIILMKRYVIYVFIKLLSFLRLLSKNKLKNKLIPWKIIFLLFHVHLCLLKKHYNIRCYFDCLHSMKYLKKNTQLNESRSKIWTTLPFSSVFLIDHVYFEFRRFLFIENL